MRNSPFNIDSTLLHPFLFPHDRGEVKNSSRDYLVEIRDRKNPKFYEDPRLGDKNMHENAFDLFSDLMGFGFWTIHIDNRIDNVSNNI